MGLWHCLAQQFRQPTGFLGLLAGFFFRINLEGIDWTISLLEIQPTDHVLEIGFGPGHGIQQSPGLPRRARCLAWISLRPCSIRSPAATPRRLQQAGLNCVSATPPPSCIRIIPSTRSLPRTSSISEKIRWRTCKNSGA